MKLTDEQRAAVRCEDNLMLTACPGSGKTRVIISKLSRTIDEVRGTPRSVACITYTNTAVHEIDARLRHQIQPGDESHYDVCTIHSFCLNHVFRPYCHLIEGYEKGFKVLTPESDEFRNFVEATCGEFNRFNLTFKDFEDFSQLRVDTLGRPVGIALEKGALTIEMAQAYWARIQRSGYIDFSNIIYFSFKLLTENAHILDHVSAKFAWILVDEFQDTTDLQVEILSLIADRDRTKFLLVGDPHQSIFRFAGARPDLADQFAERISARTDMQLSGNFRSSRPVIAHANILFPRTPPMTAVGRSRRYRDEPVWQQGSSPFEVITDHFLPGLETLDIPLGDAAILAPTWFSLFPLGRLLREYGVSIVGPGARPYRRNRVFAPLAEQICAYLNEPRPDAIVSIERTLFTTILDGTGRAEFWIFSYKGRSVVFRLLSIARTLYDQHMGALDWLNGAAEALTSVLVEAELLSPSEKNLFPVSVMEMKADMLANKVDIENLTVDDLGIYANPDAALKLSSLHNAKGREYRAVAMIDLHEGKIPFYMSRTDEEFEEAKRLFYVGVTRAEQFLMYITDTSHYRNVPTRFLRAETGVGVC